MIPFSRVGIVLLWGATTMFAACSEPSEPSKPGEPNKTGEPEVPISIRKLAGDEQIDTVFATLPLPLQVQLFRAGNVPISARVAWQPEDQPTAFTDANAAGVASFTWTLPNTSRPYHALKVQVAGADSPVVYFTARVLGGRASAIGKEYAGVTDAQVGVVGKPVLWKYGVFAFDGHGNDNASGPLNIVWNITSGGGTFGDICGPECWCENPPEKCVFYVSARHVLGSEEGPNTLTATAPHLVGARPLTFTTIGVTALVEVRALIVQARKGAAFVPDSITVRTGRSVGWIWVGDYDPEHFHVMEKHDVVFEDDPSAPTSSTPREYGIHIRRFIVPGRYRYRCTLHSSDFVNGEVGIVSVADELP